MREIQADMSMKGKVSTADGGEYEVEGRFTGTLAGELSSIINALQGIEQRIAAIEVRQARILAALRDSINVTVDTKEPTPNVDA